jgi:hypothetical protein
MKNKLIDLNNHLFEALERLNDETLSPEQLEIELKRSKAITQVANSIINNAAVVLDAQKHMDEYGYDSNSKKMPTMLLDSGDKTHA